MLKTSFVFANNYFHLISLHDKKTKAFVFKQAGSEDLDASLTAELHKANPKRFIMTFVKKQMLEQLEPQLPIVSINCQNIDMKVPESTISIDKML